MNIGSINSDDISKLFCLFVLFNVTNQYIICMDNNASTKNIRIIRYLYLGIIACITVLNVCRSIISSKLYCIKSTFASNYKYLSYRYNISHSNWYKDISHLIGKLKLKFQRDFQSRDTAQTLVELCAILDGLGTCNALSYLDACELINLISLHWYLYLLCCCT